MKTLKLFFGFLVCIVMVSCSPRAYTLVTGDYIETWTHEEGYYYCYRYCVLYSDTLIDQPELIVSFKGVPYEAHNVYKEVK